MAKKAHSGGGSRSSIGKGRSGNGKANTSNNSSEKVGSSGAAAAHVGGKGDFGIPVAQAHPGQQTVIDGSLEDRPLGSRMPPADPDGRRDVGVGAPNSGPGSYSGGDLDPDIVGVGTGEGVAASPERHTQGPDIIEDPQDPFGPPPE